MSPGSIPDQRERDLQGKDCACRRQVPRPPAPTTRRGRHSFARNRAAIPRTPVMATCKDVSSGPRLQCRGPFEPCRETTIAARYRGENHGSRSSTSFWTRSRDPERAARRVEDHPGRQTTAMSTSATGTDIDLDRKHTIRGRGDGEGRHLPLRLHPAPRSQVRGRSCGRPVHSRRPVNAVRAVTGQRFKTNDGCLRPISSSLPKAACQISSEPAPVW